MTSSSSCLLWVVVDDFDVPHLLVLFPLLLKLLAPAPCVTAHHYPARMAAREGSFSATCSTRARSRGSLARPYMLRLMSLSRFTWPSRGPLLHGRVNPARTAALSCWMPLANDFNSGTWLASTKLSQMSNCCPV